MSDVIRDVNRTPEGIIVHLAGEIDLHQIPDFHAALIDLCAEGTTRIILDLSKVEYMDSSGIGTLVEIFRRLKKENRKLILVSPAERVRSLLEITRLDQYFTVAKSSEEAKML